MVKGKSCLLNNVSLNVQLGELIVIVGANGAGKSTLIKAITGEIKYNGEINWKGKNINAFKKRDLAQQQAVMSQNISLNFDFITEEVVMMGRYPHYEEIPSVDDHQIVKNKLNDVGLSDKANQVFVTLSGGEQQRTHFARALSQVADPIEIPQLMILDEPLNNLDVKYQFELMQQVKKFTQQGNMAIMVVHDLNMAARFASRVLLLKKGNMVGLGKVDEVFTEEIIEETFEVNTFITKHPREDFPLVYFDESPAKTKRREYDKLEKIKA